MTEPTAAAQRPRAAAQAGLQRLKRVTWGSVLQVALLILALWVIVTAVTGLDVDQLTADLRGATWWLVAIAFVIAQTPRLSQTVSVLGAATRPVPARAVYLLQLAQGYAAFAAVILYRLSTFYLPASWGYFALRYLEHHDYL